MAMMQPLASNARTTNVLESFRGGKMKFQTNLAWALIEVAKPHLNVLERNYVFVTTGAGDTFAAIHHLLKLIAVKGIPLPPSLVRLCVTWLDSYAFHDHERHLRRLIEGFLLPDAVRALTAVCAERTLEVGVARTCSARLDLARGLVVARVVPAHDASCPALGKRVISAPVSAMMTSAVRVLMPAMVQIRLRNP